MGKSLKTSQRTIAAVSIASLALLNVGIMAPANAADNFTTPGFAQDGFNPSKMPETANLTITKRTPNDATKDDRKNKNHGLAVDPVPGAKPIEGVTFTLYKITDEGQELDITKNSGWKLANKIAEKWKTNTPANGATSIEVDGKTYKFAEAYAGQGKATNASGVVNFENVPRGFYVVKESIAANAQLKVGGEDIDASNVELSAPFVVALPMTNQESRNEWNTDVHVYPKNNVVRLDKKVEDDKSPGAGNVAGEEGNQKVTSKITYTVTSEVPQGVKEIKSYRLVDPLDNRLSHNNTDSVLSLLDENGDEIKKLVAGTDYEIVQLDPAEGHTSNPADPSDTVGKYVVVTFKEPGLQKLVETGVRKVQWKLPVTLNAVQVGDNAASIDNKAYLLPDNEAGRTWTPGENPPPGTPSTKVVSKYGKVSLKKVASEDNKIALEGAEFALYTCEKNGKIEDNRRVYVNNKSTWRTDEGGTFTIEGLQLNDFRNNTPGKTVAEAEASATVNPTSEYYCLVETKAPNGRELLTQPVQFQLTTANTDFSKTLTVENVPENGGFNLPLTGGKGIFGLIALGALLVLGSIGYIFFASRRQES